MLPSSVPTKLGTVQVAPVLSCSKHADYNAGSVPLSPESNGTCLFVSIMDSFGDGWANNASLFYWAQIRDEESNVVSTSLDCSCSVMSGCLPPSVARIDQLFHFTVMALDGDGNAVVPEYAWEMQWTVQVVEDGIWKEKYYGGHNTSFVFEYDREDDTYSLAWAQNAWSYPRECFDNSVLKEGFNNSFFSHRVVGDGDSAAGVSFSYGRENVATTTDYRRCAWWLYSVNDLSALRSYGEPWCGSAVSLSVLSIHDLSDGEYVIRSTGQCDVISDTNSSWEICDVSGGTEVEFAFHLVNGRCIPGRFGTVQQLCNGSMTHYPSMVPSGNPSVFPSGIPISTPTGPPSSVPSMNPSAQPSSLGTVTLNNVLECRERDIDVEFRNITDISPESNGTCLFVSIMDSFGDGWANNASLFYWAQIRDEESNVVSTSLDCSCSVMSGCLPPSVARIDQLFHFTVMALDGDGNAVVPEYAWEMQWTVQVVEDGIWKEKYYGGHNTSFVFEYDREDDTYSLAWAQNAWSYPRECFDNSVLKEGFNNSFFSHRVVGDGDSAAGVSFSYGRENVATTTDYRRCAWWLYSVNDLSALRSYGEPWCGSAVSLSVLSIHDLSDGEYVIRSTGQCDVISDTNSSWEICDVSGGTEVEFAFHLVNGRCIPGRFGTVQQLCNGSMTHYPSMVPSGNPSVFPSGIPISTPTGPPSSVPSMNPSAQPSSLGTVTLNNVLDCRGIEDVVQLSTNSTCLFVSIMDSFGDGWANDASLFYWAQIKDDESNVVSVSLDCSCDLKSGCIYPSELNIDQLYHLTVFAVDDENSVVMPAYA